MTPVVLITIAQTDIERGLLVLSFVVLATPACFLFLSRTEAGYRWWLIFRAQQSGRWERGWEMMLHMFNKGCQCLEFYIPQSFPIAFFDRTGSSSNQGMCAGVSVWQQHQRQQRMKKKKKNQRHICAASSAQFTRTRSMWKLLEWWQTWNFSNFWRVQHTSWNITFQS